ncbi:MAG: peptidoglycan-binding domain-containing protein, partial [Endomicrobiaceae bacterium]|nr:peptidoglycan-binding domain-containing protein [Endomicrobiaceae bacterium]
MSIKKFGIVAGLVFALSIVLSPAASACSLQDMSSCDNDGLMALIAQMLAGQTQPTTPTTPTTPAITGVPAGFQFNTNLKLGSTGDDVKYLQILLNTSADHAIGNAGKETTYFGSMTQAAVVKFQDKYASEVLTPFGLSKGTGFFGTSSRAKANALLSSATTPTTPTVTLPAGCTSTTGFSTTTGLRCDSGVSVVLPTGCTSTAGFSPVTGERCDSGAVAPGTPTTGAGMTVSVASGSPTGTTLVERQAIAPLAKYTLVNSDSVEAKITKVELQRTGVSGDTTLKNVYLYDGATRLTDAATISQGKVTFNNLNGVIVIPAGTSKVITVVSDIDAATSGQTVGVSLIGLTTNVDLKSTMPVAGGTQTIATATLATAVVGGITPANSTINAGTANYTVFSAPLTIGQRAVSLKGLTLKMIGSIPTDALENIQLYVNGVAAGNATVIDSNNMVRFDLSTPVAIQSGSSTLDVRANVVKGSSRNFSFSLENAADLIVVDSVYNVNVLATGIPASTGTISIAAGSVSVTTDAAFNATTVTGGVSNATLAKYNFKAFGEDVKISYLKVKSSKALDNMTVYVNGAPVTSSQNVATDGASVNFNLGSSLIVPANTTVSVEIKGDTKANGVNITAGTIAITLEPYASNNAQGVTSSALSKVPSSDVTAQSLTIGTGAVVLDTASAFASGIVAPNTANQKIGSYVIQASDAETIRISNVKVLLSATNINNLSNLYIKYGSTQSTPVAPQTTNNFPVNIEVAANQSLTVDVYADTGSLTATGSTVGMSSTNLTGGANLVGSVAQLSTATLANSAGTYAVTINGSYYYATAYGSDLEATVNALVGLVNADTLSHGITASNPASSTGAMLLTGAANGTAFTVTNVGSLPSNNVAISTTAGTVGSPATSATGTITITGTAIVDDIVKANIGGTDYSYTVAPGNTSDTKVAAELVAVINADTAYSASAATNVITVTAPVGAAGDAAVSTAVILTGGTVQSTLGMSVTGILSNSTITVADKAGQKMTVKSPTLDTPVLAVSSSPVAQYMLAGSEAPVANFHFVANDG